MPLDLHVEGNVASIQAAAQAFQALSDNCDRAGDLCQDSRNASQAWKGDAGDGFRAVAWQLRQKGQDQAAAFLELSHAAARYADALDAVIRRLNDARDRAVKGGLQVVGDQIMDPGPPPDSKPWAFKDWSERAQPQVQGDPLKWAEQAKAYAECAAMVAEARETEVQEQEHTLDWLKKITDKPVLWISSFVAGLAGGFIDRHTEMQKAASGWMDTANRLRAAGKSPELGPTGTAHLTTQSLIARAKHDVGQARVRNDRIGSWLDSLPSRAKKTLTNTLARQYGDKKWVTRTPAVFKHATPVGGIFTGAAIGIDTGLYGKDWKRSTAVNVGGWGAGTATVAGAGVGGPPGAAVGFVVSTGASMIIDGIWGAFDTKEVRTPGPVTDPGLMPGN